MQKKSNVKKPFFIFFICAVLYFNSGGLRAQTFRGAAVVGINASQMTGDSLAGYDRVGLSGGLSVGVNLTERVSLFTEFLYSQRGSTILFSLFPDENKAGIKLNYIEIPLVVKLRDFYIEDDDYYKVWAELGLSYGILIGSQIDLIPTLEYLEGQFRRNDISMILGGGLAITPHINIGFRYVRSLTKLYVAEDPRRKEVEQLTVYSIQFRLGYEF